MPGVGASLCLLPCPGQLEEESDAEDDAGGHRPVG